MGPPRPSVGVALRDPLPWHDVVQIVQSAEETGYEALFVPEIGGREAFATLAALSGVTERILLGTGVVPIISRSPGVTAMGAATVHELSGGRMVLGVGTGPARPGALGGLREHVLAVRAALSREPDRLGEQPFRVSLEPGRAPIPIWIAALGPKAMKLAGEIADGVLLNWCPPERVAFARELVREGAEASARDPSSISVAVYVRACVGLEEAVALAALRAAAGQYATYPPYRRQLEAVGLGQEAAAAAAAYEAGVIEQVPEALVRAVCLLGDAAAASSRLRAYRDAGADVSVVYPVAGLDSVSSIMGTVFALAPSSAVES